MISWNELQKANVYLDSRDVRRIIGVDAGSFAQWMVRDLLPFKTVRAGKRTWRKFHIRELPRLVLIGSLYKKLDIPIGTAIALADAMVQQVEKYLKDKNRDKFQWAHTMVYAAGRYRWMFPAESVEEVFAKVGVTSAIFISVARWITEVKAAIESAVKAHAADGKTSKAQIIF